MEPFEILNLSDYFENTELLNIKSSPKYEVYNPSEKTSKSPLAYSNENHPQTKCNNFHCRRIKDQNKQLITLVSTV